MRKNQRACLGGIPTSLFLMSSAWAAGGVGVSAYEWQGVSLHYPSGWALKESEGNTSQSRVVKLMSGTNPSVNILMTLSTDENLSAAEPSQAGKVAEAFCLPLASTLSEKDDSRIAHVPTRIGVSGNNSPSVLLLIDEPVGEDSLFRSLRCFAVYDGRCMVMDALVSGGVRGRVLDQAPFRQAVDQAYEVLNSIRLK